MAKALTGTKIESTEGVIAGAGKLSAGDFIYHGFKPLKNLTENFDYQAGLETAFLSSNPPSSQRMYQFVYILLQMKQPKCRIFLQWHKILVRNNQKKTHFSEEETSSIDWNVFDGNHFNDGR